MAQETEPVGNTPLDFAIGRVSRMWGHVEFALSVIFAELSETRPDTASAICAALQYHSIRDIIESLAILKLRGTPAQSALSQYLGSVKGMNTERNNAIHALWVNNPDTGRVSRIRMRNQGKFKMNIEAVAPGHLLAVSAKLAKLSNDGMALALQIRATVQAWREREPPLEWPLEMVDEEHLQEPSIHKPAVAPE